MTPYYADGRVTLWHGDCREVTDWLAADVLVTDPPYGTAAALDHGRGGKYGTSPWCTHGQGAPILTIDGDDSTEVRDQALALWGNRPGLVFGSWKRSAPDGARAAVVWDKGEAAGMGDLAIPWKPNWELVFVLGSGFVGRRDSGILTGNVPTWASKGREHPHAKPLGLMEKLLAKCPPGVIADPFAGSGATVVAARNAGRRVLAVELSERYCEVIARRLAQDSLFAEVAE